MILRPFFKDTLIFQGYLTPWKIYFFSRTSNVNINKLQLSINGCEKLQIEFLCLHLLPA